MEESGGNWRGLGSKIKIASEMLPIYSTQTIQVILTDLKKENAIYFK